MTMDKKKLQNMFRIMDKLLSENERPYVGIFWYNPYDKKCFGVFTSRDGEKNYTEAYDMMICSELHKDVAEEAMEMVKMK